MTLFTRIYDRFLGKITEDMYMEITPEDTCKDLQNILIDILPFYEFPRFSLDTVIHPFTSEEKNYFDKSFFVADLTSEEINILAILMKGNWLSRQIYSCEYTKQKYTGPEFSISSQANHLGKLKDLLITYEDENTHFQRLYTRRKPENGRFVSNWSSLSGSALE